LQVNIDFLKQNAEEYNKNKNELKKLDIRQKEIRHILKTYFNRKLGESKCFKQSFEIPEVNALVIVRKTNETFDVQIREIKK